MLAPALLLVLAAGLAAAGPVEDEVAGVIDLFHDLRFEEALGAARTLEDRHPGHPAGPFFTGVVHFQRYLVEDPRRPETLAEFERQTARSLAAAEAWRSSSPASAEYYLGAAHGFRARVLSMEKRRGEAISEARKALGHVRKAVALDPADDDVYLGMGMYNYFMSRIPAGIKPLAYLMMGTWGDKEEGLGQLKRAAQKGKIARWEARSVLANIFGSERERRWEEAEALLQELMERYPRNPGYRMRRAYVFERMGRWDRALALVEPKGAWVEKVEPSVRALALAAARYRSAEIMILSGRPSEAQAHLHALVQADLPSNLKDWVALRRANLLDLAGERKMALAIYGRITDRWAKPAAEGFMKEAFPGGPNAVQPFRWPMSEVVK